MEGTNVLRSHKICMGLIPYCSGTCGSNTCSVCKDTTVYDFT